MFKKLAIHPILISAYAVLFLYSSNISELAFHEVRRSLLAAILFSGILLCILKILTKDWYKAALISSAGLILFFTYGHVMDLARGFSMGPVMIGRTAVMASVWILVFVLFVWRILLMPSAVNLSSLLNVTAVFLLAWPSYTIASYVIQSEKAASLQPVLDQGSKIQAAQGPSVYYIVLDMHGRADVHHALYGYDETWFIEGLKQRGFYVAEQSTSNYSSTLPSISSSLNMEYINDLEEAYGPDATTHEPYKNLLEQNKLFQAFREQGYKIGAFETNFKHTEFSNVDVYLGPSSKELRQYQNFWTLNTFEGLLLRSTFFRSLYDLDIMSSDAIQEKTIESPYLIHRLTILHIFEHLPDFAAKDEPYFIFAHVVSPHPPYIFGPEGEEMQHTDTFSLGAPGRQDGGQQIVTAYVNQLHFIDTLVLQTVDRILASSKIPPIILLQGDHGPYSYFGANDLVKTNMQEQHGILNAYYFPDQQYERLYPSITPVNSFRIVLNTFFGGHYELLPDKNYYHSHSETFRFIDVTNRVKTDPLTP
jgi:hypothetical protein